MKKLIAVAAVLAFAGAQIQTAKPGDREWATAGKILTGVAIGAVIAGAANSHASYSVSYSTGPAYYPPPRVVCPPPVVYVPPRVIVAPTPVVYAPRPVVIYHPPVRYGPPAKYVKRAKLHRYESHGPGHPGRYDKPDRRGHR
jgi:hypothetical protein